MTDHDGETHEPGSAWTIQDWQHQGYQRILSRYESFSTHHAPDQPLDGVHNPDISIQIEEMFTYAPPMSDGAHPASFHLPPVLVEGRVCAAWQNNLLPQFLMQGGVVWCASPNEDRTIGS